jgi:ribosomal protein S12 methylthiotransferase accessory factor
VSSRRRDAPSAATSWRGLRSPSSSGRASLIERTKLIVRGDRRRDLERLLGLWDDLVDPRVGVIQKVAELRVDDDEPDFFHYLSTACDTAAFKALSNFGNNGGASVDRYGALAKALGEAVERYCSAIFDYRDFTLAAYDDLDERATPPDAFALYRPEQHEQEGFPWQPLGGDSLVNWTRGRSLVTGDETLIPAACVFVPYHYLRSRPDTPFVQPISTGLACGSSYDEATLSGLCEVVERDAFTLMWQARMSRPRVSPAGLPATARDALRRFDRAGLRVEIVDITTDIRFPTIFTVAIGDAPSSPAIAVAAATDASAERAVVKSLEELAHTRTFARQLLEYTPPVEVDVAGGHSEVVDQKTHLRFYCPQEAKAFAEFTWSSDEVRGFADVVDRTVGDPAADLSTLVEELGRAGLDAVVVDLTTADIASLGLSVVRAVVPGLHPLFMGHRNRALGGRRLYAVPQQLGHEGLERGEQDNLYPHPFP